MSRRRKVLGLFSAICVGVVAIAIWLWPKQHEPIGTPSDAPQMLWAFEAPRAGAIVSTPVVDGAVVYVGAIRDSGFSPRGAVHALDRRTGKVIWTFDDGGEMLHMYSSPRLTETNLFIGEGMHANFECKLYCLNRRDGTKRWAFPTRAHIESTACVSGERIIFGAGDDGLYALNIESGKLLWQFDHGRHIDSTPAVQGDRVYAGSGFSRKLRDMAVMCVDLQSGREKWSIPVELPAWGSPDVDGDRVCFGLGEGRLDRSVDRPKGAMLCLESVTGKQIWRRELPDAVMARTAHDHSNFYAACRDGCCYALDRNDGRVVWQTQLESALAAAPVLADGRLYVPESAGRMSCLESATGRTVWTYDVASLVRLKTRMYSSAAVIHDENGARQIFFGTELETATSRIARLYALAD